MLFERDRKGYINSNKIEKFFDTLSALQPYQISSLNPAVTMLIGALFNKNTKWQGNKEVTGALNQPQDIADFDPSVLGMTLTDGLKRDADGNLSRSGKVLNTTNRMISLINKLFNKSPTVLEDIKFGLISEPLIQYTTDFESGLVKGGDYVNGVPEEVASSVSTIEGSTYSPDTDQDTVVHSDLYVNVLAS